MSVEILIAFVVLFPLAGAVINGLFGKIHGRHLSGYIACMAMLAAFVCAVGSVGGLAAMPAHTRSIHTNLYTWIETASFRADLAFTLDPLSAVMILVVTGVGFLIHVYSLGYMAHDDGRARFFTYLNLFCFFMLTLVLGSSVEDSLHDRLLAEQTRSTILGKLGRSAESALARKRVKELDDELRAVSKGKATRAAHRPK